MPHTLPIPKDTARAARAIFGSSNCYIILGNRLNKILTGYSAGNHLLPGMEQRFSVPVLPFLTLFQYSEWQTDRQAVDALRSRVDWKYALHIPLKHPGLPEGALCQYRQRYLSGQTEQPDLQELLERLADDEALGRFVNPSIDARKMITSICILNRFAQVLEALSAALTSLASQNSNWLLQIARPHWFIRYYPGMPSLFALFSKDETEILANEIGKDVHYLLEQIDSVNDPQFNRLEEITTLQTVWRDQFGQAADGTIQFLPKCTGCPSNQPINGSTTLEG